MNTQTPRMRLDSHSHARTAREKEYTIVVHDGKQARFEAQGLVLVLADRSVDEIVDDILARIKK